MKSISITLLFLIVLSNTFGQDMKWPEDRATAEVKVALYSDEIEFENYRSAADHLYWLLINAPELHVSIYQNGAKIYENLAIEATDQELRNIYLDSLMIMYDLRMNYYDDSANVMNRKAYKAYKYYIKDDDRYEWLLEIFDNTVEVAGDATLTNNLPAYMNVIKVSRLVNKNLTLDEVFSRYDNIINILDHKASKGADVQKIKDLVDKLLTETIPEGIDCEFVLNNLGPKFKADPTDIPLAKRIFGFMLNGKCTEDELFLDVAKQIQKEEPTFGMAYKLIGKKCMAEKDYECAAKYFSESVELAENNEEKAQVYNDLGRLYLNLDQKVKAREYYRHTLTIDPGNTEAYNGLGNLYYYSASECSEMKDVVEDRLPYIAAYQMYEKAGNERMMLAAKEQFPSKEEIFTKNKEAGIQMTIKCWINESVILRTRD